MSNRRRSPVLFVVCALVLALLVYLAILGVSGASIYRSAGVANEAYEKCEQCINEGDVEGSIEAIRDVAGAVEQMQEQSSGWQWNVASYVPVLGEDVVCARKTIAVLDRLLNEGVIPAIASVENTTKDWTQIGSVPGALNSAYNVVHSCRAEVDSIPVSHFDELNSAVDNVKTAVYNIDDTIDSLGTLSGVANLFT